MSELWTFYTVTFQTGCVEKNAKLRVQNFQITTFHTGSDINLRQKHRRTKLS